MQVTRGSVKKGDNKERHMQTTTATTLWAYSSVNLRVTRNETDQGHRGKRQWREKKEIMDGEVR